MVQNHHSHASNPPLPQTTKLLSRRLASLTTSVTLAAHGLISSMQAKLGTGTKGSSPASSSENTKEEGTKRSLSASQEWTLCAEGSARPGEKPRRGLSCPRSCLVSLISSSLKIHRRNCQMGATNKCTKRAYWNVFTVYRYRSCDKVVFFVPSSCSITNQALILATYYTTPKKSTKKHPTGL